MKYTIFKGKFTSNTVFLFNIKNNITINHFNIKLCHSHILIFQLKVIKRIHQEKEKKKKGKFKIKILHSA